MGIERTYEEINQKIRSGKAVVLTAEEVVELVAERGVAGAAAKVDVVTTGTLDRCVPPASFKFWPSKPRIKMNEVYLNTVPAYAGVAAVTLSGGHCFTYGRSAKPESSR